MSYPRQRVYFPFSNAITAIQYLFSGSLIKGPGIEEFEQAFAKFIGVKEAIAVPSGRTGLKYIFDGLRIGPGSEIIIPAYTYPIVPYVTKALGYKPVFVDIEIPSLGLDIELVEKTLTKNTKAIIATHLFGVPCKIREIMELSKAHGINVIEDCAHACGASVGAVKTGAFGRLAYFSFETSKCVNTLGGGMIATSDKEIADRIRGIRDMAAETSKVKIFKKLAKSGFEALATWPPLFSMAFYPLLRLVSMAKGTGDAMGAGYVGSDITMSGRMDKYTNYQARLGLQGLETLSQINKKRADNAFSLIEALRDHTACQEPVSPEDAPNFLLSTVLVPEMEEIALRLLRAGIDTKRHYMRNCGAIYGNGRDFPNAEKADKEVLHLPSYPELSQADLKKIADTLKRLLAKK